MVSRKHRRVWLVRNEERSKQVRQLRTCFITHSYKWIQYVGDSIDKEEEQGKEPGATPMLSPKWINEEVQIEFPGTSRHG